MKKLRKEHLIVTVVILFVCAAAFPMLGPFYGGQFIGAIIGSFLMQSLLQAILKRKIQGEKLLVVTSTLTVIIATVLFGYGNADGEEPDFVASFLVYFPTTLIVFLSKLYCSRKAEAKKPSFE